MLVKPLWPVAEYIMNYDYIVNVLCENKDRPKLKCDGKCYLAQMLAEESQQQNKNPFGNKQAKTEMQHTVFYQSLLSLDFGIEFKIQKENNFKNYCAFTSRLFTSDIAQPPELI